MNDLIDDLTKILHIEPIIISITVMDAHFLVELIYSFIFLPPMSPIMLFPFRLA